MAELVVIGAGNEAKPLIAAAQKMGNSVRALYDDDPTRWGAILLGVPVLGPTSQAGEFGLAAIMSYESPQQRREMSQRLQLTWTTVIHPAAFVHPTSRIGLGCFIAEGVVIQPSVIVGAHVVAGANATLAHDCEVGDYCYLWPGVDLAGAVHVDPGCKLDVGAAIIPNVRVGEWTNIGPRAVVISDIPAHSQVGGMPARPVGLR